MRWHARNAASALILSTVLAASALCAADGSKPKVRAITGFITIDKKSYASQIADAVKFLSHVRDVVKTAGYDVAGIRISTQPFPQYTRGLGHNEALSVLRGIDDLSASLHFAPNKPLAVRLLPSPGKKVGDVTEFSGMLANAKIQPLVGTPRR